MLNENLAIKITSDVPLMFYMLIKKMPDRFQNPFKLFSSIRIMILTKISHHDVLRVHFCENLKLAH